MTQATLKNINGYPAIVINGKVYPPMTATINTSRKVFGQKGREIDSEYFKALGDSGIKIFYVMCNNSDLEDCAISDFKYEVEMILSAVPDAYIMARIVLNPSEKWIKENPDHVVTYSDNRKINTKIATETFDVIADGMPSLCSWKWREDMGRTLIRMLEEIGKFSFNDRIIGFFVGAGGTSEWYYLNPIDDFGNGAYADLSKAFEVEFQNYLDNKYGKDKVKAVIPDTESRFFAEEIDRVIPTLSDKFLELPVLQPPKHESSHGSFLDIDKCMNTFDFYRAWTNGTANSIIYFSKLIKENRPNTLVGAFYGSMGGSEIIWASNSSAVIKVLDSGYVDFLANPGVYENRQPGGFTGQRQCPDSFRLRNTMYITEDDTRSHTDNAHVSMCNGLYCLNDTINVMKRDFGRDICEDLHSWWFDQLVSGGRYKFREAYELFAKQQKIAEIAYGFNRIKGNEIAFIYDEESVHVASKQSTDDCVQVIKNYEIANIGAGVDSYFHNDMSNSCMPDYKLYVFCNCFYLTDKEREDIKNKLKKNNATALFLYGNGIINPDREKKLDVNHISEFTEINCKELMECRWPVFKIIEDSHEIVGNLESNKLFGMFLKKREKNSMKSATMPYSYLYPVIYADDNDTITIGKFLCEDIPAVSVKKVNGFISIYCGSKYISSDFLREVARFAGCHIYNDDGHVLHVNNNFITIHGSKNGKVNIKLKNVCTPFEVYEEKKYGENVSEFSFDIKLGETKMFQLLR